MTLDRVIARNIESLINRFGVNQAQLFNQIEVPTGSIDQLKTSDLEKVVSYFHIELQDLLEEDEKIFELGTIDAYCYQDVSTGDLKAIEKFKIIFGDFCKMSLSGKTTNP